MVVIITNHIFSSFSHSIKHFPPKRAAAQYFVEQTRNKLLLTESKGSDGLLKVHCVKSTLVYVCFLN